MIFVHGVTNENLSPVLNYGVDVVTLPKFGNSGISMREVIVTPVLSGFDRKNQLFGEVILVVGLTPGIDLNFHTSVAKGLKLKVRKA